MAAFVVDTNVPIVANGKSHPGPDCVIACLEMLSEIRSTGVIVLDDAMRILDEYRTNLSLGGQPGAGDAFMKWVWNVQADESRCERVVLTQRNENNPDDFVEFPDDPDLAAFDPRDRKFVAVALASRRRPTILNATDPDWAESYKALARNGISVRFLCPQETGSGG